MITSLEIFSPNPAAPSLPVGGGLVNDDVIQMREVGGIEPVKADISSTALATGRGQYFQGSSTGVRNIVLTLGLNPDWEEQTIASLRTLLYAYFMPELETKLRFYTDNLPVVDISGIVESVEPNIFSKDPEMQISIMCHQPDFVEPDPVIIDGIVTNALIDGVPTEYSFNYDGSAPTDIRVKVRGTPSKLTYGGRLVVANQTFNTYEVFDVDPIEINADTPPTKYFYLTTVKTGRKIETVASDGVITNLLKRMAGSSRWIELKPGENIFSIAAEESGLVFQLVYYNRYGGL